MDGYAHDGLTFRVRDAGDPAGAAVVLLHGFPQDGSAYDAVVPLLVGHGLRVLAPDQRGYSPGARPRGRAPYRLDRLVGDVVALLDAAGVDRAVVAGHDWGGAVAWDLAGRHPARVRGLVALSTPHPAAMVAALTRSTQALRSSYMAAFQVPALPERALLAHDGARLRRALVASGLEPARADRYVARMREPGALTAALAWYRALPLPGGGGGGPTRVPTTYLYGEDDPFFAPAGVVATARFVRAPFRSVRVPGGHWVPEGHPAAVAAAVVELAGAR
ncbi:alpha/beta fold hydrolase [Cellulomonas marina]|uniref:Pimeloyl-ACP methyl ester carboxylesterase n=1 Tax=Cellulomonas marina TaxID=988821 RepID=A0A1I0ZWM4_9CELL|nr:alpha/beta fold hydrolase [Cellulomonas marina]GIG29408.1 alpha/beta hydrolase [Cellulomonas marina]SFB29947.1 Pimeloyl-ACP methyl ester carboxylesterase [Cellulomonas marina]